MRLRVEAESPCRFGALGYLDSYLAFEASNWFQAPQNWCSWRCTITIPFVLWVLLESTKADTRNCDMRKKQELLIVTSATARDLFTTQPPLRGRGSWVLRFPRQSHSPAQLLSLQGICLFRGSSVDSHGSLRNSWCHHQLGNQTWSAWMATLTKLDVSD